MAHPPAVSFYDQVKRLTMAIRAMVGTWQREDVTYAAATLGAAVLVLYLMFANFGLAPSPFASPGFAARPIFGVPTLGAGLVPGSSTTGRNIPTLPTLHRTPVRVGLHAPVDRTPPQIAFTTASGTRVTLTQAATVEGTASDTSGIRSVLVTFRTSGGTPETVPATLACNRAPGQTGQSCIWSAPVPSIVGSYSIDAVAVDRSSNSARTGPITMTVVNGGTVVNTVTGVVGGVVNGVGSVLGGLLGR